MLPDNWPQSDLQSDSDWLMERLEKVKGELDRLESIPVNSVTEQLKSAADITNRLMDKAIDRVGESLGKIAERLKILQSKVDTATAMQIETEQITKSTVASEISSAGSVSSAAPPTRISSPSIAELGGVLSSTLTTQAATSPTTPGFTPAAPIPPGAYALAKNPAPVCPVGEVGPYTTYYDGVMKCTERCVNIADYGVDPNGEIVLHEGSTWPEASKECCLPICGAAPGDGGGGFPGGTPEPQQINVSVELKPSETEPTPGATTEGSDVPPVGDKTSRCGVDAYGEFAHRTDEPPVTGQLRIFRHLLYGTPDQQDKFVEEITGHETSLFPSRQAQGAFQRGVLNAATRIDEIIGGWVVGSGCFSAEHTLSTIEKALVNLISLFVGDSLDALSVPLGYKVNALCPVCYPDQRDALDCFLRGTIDRSTYETWVKQNNYCVEPFDRVVEARQQRPTATDLLMAWRRKFLDDERVDKELRNLGFIDSDFRQWLKDLTNFIPPIQDLIRFMVRDVESSEIVSTFGMDDYFDTNWAGQAKEWGQNQGISDEVAKRYWRAHWSIPSPGQLFEMYHVSRALPDGDPAKTTLKEVETALRQQDILPFWIPRLLVTTYSRLTRVDSRRAFNTGVLSEERLLNNYRRLGYREEDATTLVEWSKRERIKLAPNSRDAKLYKSGVIDADTLIARLVATGLTAPEANEVLAEVRIALRAPVIRRCIAALRKRVLYGEIQVAQYRIELLNLGLRPERVELEIEAINCELVHRGKDPSTAVLCQWFDQGLLSSAEYADRLERIGWSTDDAIRIMSQCRTKISAKAMQEAQKRAKQEKAAADKAQKESERQQAKRQREAKQSQRALEIAQRARQRREVQTARATEVLAELTSTEVAVAGSAVQSALTTLASDYLLTADTRVQAVTLAVEKFQPETLEAFDQRVRDIADELERLATLPPLG